MDSSNSTETLSTWAVLATKDYSMWEMLLQKYRCTPGQLTLMDKSLVFAPKDSGSKITIPLTSVVDADFTNILAKQQFVLRQQDGTVSAISFGPGVNDSWGRGLKYLLLRPASGIYAMTRPHNVVNAGVLSLQWRDALLKALPAQVVRQRTEIRPGVVVLVGLTLAGLLTAILAAFIWLIPHG